MEKIIGKLFVIGFHGKKVPKEIKELIQRYHIGGIILFTRNIGTPEEVLSLTAALQSEAKAAGYTQPLLICIDQENGAVRRLGEGTTIFPGSMALGASDSPENAYNVGFATGKELLALGINWNLAPVVDVNNNPENPVIGVRSFGESPKKVAKLGKAMMKGMQDAGVVTTLKHFPGHGDTNTDSHLSLPTIQHQMERLEAVELFPFKEGIKAGADLIMTAHIHFSAIEQEKDKPATLSKAVITGLLRERLAYSGVVTTDCMEMKAISETIGTEKGAVAALEAGADMVMISHTLERQKGALQEVMQAVKSGKLDQAALRTSSERIRSLKNTYLHWNHLFSTPKALEAVGTKEHEELSYNVYRECVTLVKNEGILPLTSKNVLVLTPEDHSGTPAEDKKYSGIRLVEAMRAYCPEADEKYISEQMPESESSSLLAVADLYTCIIVGTLNLAENPKQQKLIHKIVAKGIPVIAVAMRSPYDVSYLSVVQACICTYDYTYPALKIAAGAIFGKEQVTGKLPVMIETHS